jgi:hypothetical protein
VQDLNGSVRDLVSKTGYRTAVTVCAGSNEASDDFLLLRREMPMGKTISEFSLRLSYSKLEISPKAQFNGTKLQEHPLPPYWSS